MVDPLSDGTITPAELWALFVAVRDRQLLLAGPWRPTWDGGWQRLAWNGAVAAQTEPVPGPRVGWRLGAGRGWDATVTDGAAGARRDADAALAAAGWYVVAEPAKVCKQQSP